MIRTIALSVAIPAIACSLAGAAQFEVRAGEKGNRVVFVSKAAMESFEGATDQVSGDIEADLAHLADSVRVRIEVDLASLDTGIGMRNKHMRENHLETDTYPKAVFTAGRIVSSTASALNQAQPARITLAGQMSLHGVTREVQYDLALSINPSGQLKVAGEFTIKLSDYDIDRPKFLILRLADEQAVRVTLTAIPSAGNGR
jgi:polyisoprenoid-binding protein YceI